MIPPPPTDPAIEPGPPRTESGPGPLPAPIPYSRQWLDDEDIEAVASVLRSDWLTTGPVVDRFERAFARSVGAQHAVAVNSGTAALHAAMRALNLEPGDEVIVPALSFVATANGAAFEGATPVFADVHADSLLVDVEHVRTLLSDRTRAVVSVDYAGQPVDYPALTALTASAGLPLISDACHSLGGRHGGKPIGSQADLSAFSFHAVKAITTGEGGMLTTDNSDFANRARRFRNHGLDRDHQARSRASTWEYDMADLGRNYRLSDFQCALGLSQLGKLPTWIRRRREIAARYDAAFAGVDSIEPLASPAQGDSRHAYHLYVVRVRPRPGTRGPDRDTLFHQLRARGIGVNVHYRPIHLHSYYRGTLDTRPGMCPRAEQAYREILSLPIYPRMGDDTVETVIETIRELCV